MFTGCLIVKILNCESLPVNFSYLASDVCGLGGVKRAGRGISANW